MAVTTRKTSCLNKVALLATGDEIIYGDILNSNAQEIAYRLYHQSIIIGTHMVASDNLVEIETAIQFLLQHHEALIITGGLGPTSDDLTRYALSNVIKRKLVFDTPTWRNIVRRLKRFGYSHPPETNRQQALFPQGATIIPNPNGTAAGCLLHHRNKLIFMLPGPPIECLPMINTVVLPTLQKASFQQILYREKWLLFGVSEGEIAEKLDALAKPFQCVTGYRICYPYIEFKLLSHHPADFSALLTLVKKTITPYLIGTGKKTASALLREKLSKSSHTLIIHDAATGGLLESILKTPRTYSRIFLSTNRQTYPATALYLQMKGLKDFWQQNKTAVRTSLEMTFIYKKKKLTLKTTIPYRGKHVLHYAVEFICKETLKLLSAK